MISTARHNNSPVQLSTLRFHAGCYQYKASTFVISIILKSGLIPLPKGLGVPTFLPHDTPILKLRGTSKEVVIWRESLMRKYIFFENNSSRHGKGLSCTKSSSLAVGLSPAIFVFFFFSRKYNKITMDSYIIIVLLSRLL